MTRIPGRIYGVVGCPAGQSLSPALHNWAFSRAGHDGAYFAFEKRPPELPDFFRAVRSLPLAGLSVTIPHKENAAALVDVCDEDALAAGAVNTVYRREGRLFGGNTDIAGFAAPLRALGRPLPETALLLGAGGACRAALAALRSLGVPRIIVAARAPAKAAFLNPPPGGVPPEIIPWETREGTLATLDSALVVNLTPLGMRGGLEGESPLGERAFARLRGGDVIVYDAVYTPQRTLFLRLAGRHGLVCLDGLGFFLAQAAGQFRLWTGLEFPPEEEARAVVLQALEARAKERP